MAECRHGFDQELCDICSPRQAPQPVRSAPAVRKPAASRAREAQAPRTLRGPAAAEPAAAPEVPFGKRRIYHVTHRDNLAAILAEGAIVAGATPEVDALSAEAREERAGAEAIPGAPVSEFVPFAVSPDAAWWMAIRDGADDERYSKAARTASPSDFVVLVGTTVAAGAEIVVTNGEAGASTSSFAVGPEASAALLRRTQLRDPELAGAEVLVRHRYPVADLAMIATANEPVRSDVKALVAEHGATGPRLASFPPFFQPTPAE